MFSKFHYRSITIIVLQQHCQVCDLDHLGVLLLIFPLSLPIMFVFIDVDIDTHRRHRSSPKCASTYSLHLVTSLVGSIFHSMWLFFVALLYSGHYTLLFLCSFSLYLCMFSLDESIGADDNDFAINSKMWFNTRILHRHTDVHTDGFALAQIGNDSWTDLWFDYARLSLPSFSGIDRFPGMWWQLLLCIFPLV